eukprot:Seg1181.2 transcript_id=Seg1181.2/GoldUCD/mRNA.D3Y31 product="hypothetical protein" protein_id=Seg1181.2/GoldUCD/D3Y31
MTAKRDVQLRFVLDVINNIKKVKKKKLERGQIVCDVQTLLGLSTADSYSLIEELLSMGILCNNEGSLDINYKQRFELTKSLVDFMHNILLPQPDVQTKSTDEKQAVTDEMMHHCGIADDIAYLGKSVHDDIHSLKALVSSRSTSDASKSPPHTPPGPPLRLRENLYP